MKIISVIFLTLLANTAFSQNLLFRDFLGGDPTEYKTIRVGMTEAMVRALLYHMPSKFMSYYDPIGTYTLSDGTELELKFISKTFGRAELKEIKVIEPESKGSESFKVKQYFITPTEQGR